VKVPAAENVFVEEVHAARAETVEDRGCQLVAECWFGHFGVQAVKVTVSLRLFLVVSKGVYAVFQKLLFFGKFGYEI